MGKIRQNYTKKQSFSRGDGVTDDALSSLFFLSSFLSNSVQKILACFMVIL